MFIIIDTEFTSWKGALKRNWSKINEYKELIQIGYLIFDNNLNIIDKGSIYFKPKINPILSKYFINLTNISQKLINKHGNDFLSGIKKFWKIVSDNIIVSYGDDLNIIYYNYKIYNYKIPIKKINYVNIKPLIHKRYIINNLTSGELYKLTPFTNKKSHNHNAEWDVYSIYLFITHYKLLKLIYDHSNI